MKRILMSLIVATTALTAVAQQPGGDREQQRQERQKHQAQQVARRLGLDEAKTAWFTPLFVEYQSQLQAVRRAQRSLFPKPEGGEAGKGEGKKGRPELTDEQAQKLLNGYFSGQQAELQIKQQYCQRFAEQLTVQQLAQFFVFADQQRNPQHGGGRFGQGQGGPRQGGFGGQRGGSHGGFGQDGFGSGEGEGF